MTRPFLLLAATTALLSAQNVPSKDFPKVTIAPELTLDRFADNTQIANPTALCIDGQGRVFASETHRWRVQVQDIRHGGPNNKFLRDRVLGDISSMTLEDREAFHKKWSGVDKDYLTWDQFDDQAETIILLEDTTGDGKADRRIPFRDDFNAPLAGPSGGLIEKDGTVYFAMIPGIYSLRDLDGDGKAEEVKTLVTGFGVRVSFSGHDMNGFAFGPDGKLYWSIGDRGYHVEQNGKTFARPDSGAIFRSNPDGSDFEVFAFNLRNPKEIVFDEFGNLFTVDNDYDHGDRERIVYVVEHGDSGWREGHQTFVSFSDYAFNHIGPKPPRKEDQLDPWMNEGLWEPRHDRQPAYILPPIANTINGPCGLAYNPGGTTFPERFAKNFFVVSYVAAPDRCLIENFSLKPDGAGFALKETSTFLKGIAMTDLDWGYDGKMYISDYGGGWERPNNSNIYTLYDPKRLADPLVQEVKQLFAKGIPTLAPDKLFDLLAHPDQRVRQRAQFALAERGNKSRPLFEKAIATDQPLLRRLHGLWGLGQLAANDPAALQPLAALLKDSEVEVRANAARTLGTHPTLLEPYRAQLIALLHDPSLRVVSLAALALANHGHQSAVNHAIAMLLANDDKDVVVRHGGIMILAECSPPALLLQMTSNKSPAVRRAAVVALRRQEAPEIAAFFDDEDTSVRQEAIRGAYEQRITEAFPALSKRAVAIAKRVTPEVKYHPLSARRAIYAAWTLARPEDLAVVTSIANDPAIDFRVRRDAFLALLDWNIPPTPDPVTAFVHPLPANRTALTGATAEMLEPYFDAAATDERASKLLPWALKLTKQEKLPVSKEHLASYLTNQETPEEARLLALDLLAARQKATDQWKKTLEALSSDKSDKIRSQAREILLRLNPDAKALALFAQTLDNEKSSITEKQLTLQTLGKLTGPEAAKIIKANLDKLIANQVQPGIALDIVLAAEASDDPEVKSALAAFRAGLPQDDPLAEWKRLCQTGGDIESGMTIFFGHGTAQCQRCHTMNGVGGDVGPELAAIGKSKDANYLLRALLDPQAEVAEGYGVGSLTLKDGSVIGGNLLPNDKDGNARVMVGEELKRIPQNQIASRSQPVSAMPPMAGILTPHEMRDLLAFLTSCKEDKTDDGHK